jgi:superfamily II DNA or RNA helicase|tara:strand:+ start:4084 stop:5310 length:1227 start_codon:yes stop_codon:yes gene_type:complete
MKASAIKDQIQRKGLNKWWAYPVAGKGTLQYATGVGKTRCGVLAAAIVAKRLNMDCQILILTPTQTIRDRSWSDEFTKWGEKDIFDTCVKCVCIQTAYKWYGQKYDLVIADEIHNYIAPEFFNFFANNKYSKILGLSAYIDPVKLNLLNAVAPICDRISTTEASRLGLISKFTIYNVPLDLGGEEKIAYRNANNNFARLFPIFDKNLKIMYACMKPAIYEQHLARRGEVIDIDNKTYPYQCNAAMSNRKKLLYNASTKLDAVKYLCDLYPEKKTIIFSQTIDFADKVTELLGDSCVSFHSKIGKKARTANLDSLIDNRTKVTRISTAKALNEGVNVPDISMAIIASGTSKVKDLIQRVGRVVRWEEGKQALIFHLYIEDSQEEKWVASSQIGHSVEVLRIGEELSRHV